MKIDQQFNNRSVLDGRCAERLRQRGRIIEKTKDVEREDLWRFVMTSDLISLSIDNRLY
jgi:hypothetical protein